MQWAETGSAVLQANYESQRDEYYRNMAMADMFYAMMTVGQNGIYATFEAMNSDGWDPFPTGGATGSSGSGTTDKANESSDPAGGTWTPIAGDLIVHSSDSVSAKEAVDKLEQVTNTEISYVDNGDGTLTLTGVTVKEGGIEGFGEDLKEMVESGNAGNIIMGYDYLIKDNGKPLEGSWITYDGTFDGVSSKTFEGPTAYINLSHVGNRYTTNLKFGFQIKGGKYTLGGMITHEVIGHLYDGMTGPHPRMGESLLETNAVNAANTYRTYHCLPARIIYHPTVYIHGEMYPSLKSMENDAKKSNYYQIRYPYWY